MPSSIEVVNSTLCSIFIKSECFLAPTPGVNIMKAICYTGQTINRLAGDVPSQGRHVPTVGGEHQIKNWLVLQIQGGRNIKHRETKTHSTHEQDQTDKATNPVISIRSARILLLYKVPQVVIIVEIEDWNELLRVVIHSIMVRGGKRWRTCVSMYAFRQRKLECKLNLLFFLEQGFWGHWNDFMSSCSSNQYHN